MKRILCILLLLTGLASAGGVSAATPRRTVLLPAGAQVNDQQLASWSAERLEGYGDREAIEIPETEWANVSAAFPSAVRLDEEHRLILPTGSLDTANTIHIQLGERGER